MVKIINIEINGNTLSCRVLCDGNANNAFDMTVDISTEWFDVKSSTANEHQQIEQRQACVALLRYKGKPFPKETTGMWY